MMKNSMRWIMIIVLIMTIALASCQQESIVVPEDSSIKMNYDVPKDQYFDSEGNLQVPFDVAYRDIFNQGGAPYDENTLLIKFKASFDGVLSRNLKNAGVSTLQLTMKNNQTAWYLATIKDQYTVKNVMSTVRKLDEVLVADYNYLYDTKTFDPITYPEIDVSKNPRSSELWHLEASKIDTAWKWLEYSGYQPGGASNVVVAVIDTGVDYNHIDLKANMWVNTNEIPNNSIDDDANGYVDDVHGANMISDPRYHSGDPMDDHGHGTHVAGIIAASNNQEGVVGVAYNAKIMAIKAGMQSGQFTQADIAEAILYAYDMGADVINMSFGGSAVSIAVQDALMTAYTRAILVASAGNSGTPNERTKLYPALPNYPAALSYVIGVMSVGQAGIESPFTNWDVKAFNNVEYELYAPGEQILSTLPNNKYAAWSGTSMAAPVVSGIAALLRSAYTDLEIYPNKFIMGQLSSTSESSAECIDPDNHEDHNLSPIVDAYLALTKLPKPNISLYNYYIFDSKTIAPENNGDGIIDAGETLDIGMVLRNRWGMSSNTIVTFDTLTTGGVTSPYLEFLTNELNFGSIGTYSTKDMLQRDGSIITGVETPLKVKVASNTPNDYIITMNIHGTYTNALDVNDTTTYQFSTTLDLQIRNGFLLPNIISSDMTLTKDKYYIIPNSMVIQAGATVTVEPGTSIQFWTNDPEDAYAELSIVYLKVEGRFLVQGTEEEPVKLFPSQLMDRYLVEIYRSGIDAYISFEYAEVTNGHLNINRASHSRFTQNYMEFLYNRYLEGGSVSYSYLSRVNYIIDYAENSIFYALGTREGWNMQYYVKPMMEGVFDHNIFVNSGVYISANSVMTNNVFLGNNTVPYQSYISSIALLPQASELSGIPSYMYNNQNGHTYYMLQFSGSLTYQSMQLFAESLGGQLAQFETVEEYQYFIDHHSSESCVEGIIGIKRDLITGQYTWGDGSIIGDFFDLDQNPNKKYYVYSCYYDEFVAQEGNRFSSAIIEFPGDIYIDQIWLDKDSIDIDLESIYQINQTVIPSTANPEEIIYISSDEGVATVDSSGCVHPISYGETTITAYSKDYLVSDSLVVRVVEKVELMSIDIPSTSIQMNINTTKQITFELNPINTTELMFIYTSDQPEIASIDTKGVLKANSVGQTIIHVSNFNGSIFDTVTVRVVNPVTSIAFSEAVYMTALDGDDVHFYPIVLPVDATNQTIIWQSSNPEVAYVNESGILVKISEGVTTIVATIENTNLFDEIIVSIKQEQTIGFVKKMNIFSYDINLQIALYSDGYIYYWGANVLSPKRLPLVTDDFIVDYAFINGNHLITLNNMGIVKAYNLWEFIHYGASNINIYSNDDYGLSVLSNITQLTHTSYGFSSGSVFALRSDGSVWSFGSNASGELGDGTRTNRSTPIQVMINDVKSIAAGASFVMFLQNDGDLYATGGYTGVTIPQAVQNNVTSIDTVMNNNYVISRSSSDTRLYSHYAMLSSSYIFTSPYKGYLDNSSSTQFYIQDGILYTKGDNTQGRFGIGDQHINSYINAFTPTLKINNVQDIFLFGHVIYFQTSTGEFYGAGSNQNRELANFTNVSSGIPTRVHFGLEGNPNGFDVEQTNLQENQLFNEEIIVDFNEAIMIGSQFSYITLKDSSQNMLAITRQISLDKLTITPFNQLVIGETYTLTIPASAVNTKFMIDNTLITYTFIYRGEQTPLQYIGANITENDILTDQNAQISLDYTYALAGTNYSDIGIYDLSNNQVSDITVTLENGVLTLHGHLAFASYYVYVPAGALQDSLGGSNLELTIPFSVQEVLMLLSSSHENGSDRHMIDESIIMTFNVATEHSEFVNIHLLDHNGMNVPAAVTLTSNVLTIDPTDSLSMGQTYRILIPEMALIDGLSNTNALIDWMFTTYEPIVFIRSSIANDATRVSLNQTIAFYFNYIEEGPSYNSITMTNASGQQVLITTSIINHSALTIKPISTLSPCTTYTIHIPSGAVQDELDVLQPAIDLTFTTIEIDERFYWTTTNVMPMWQAFVEKGYNTNFINNAFLNNFNQTNVGLWLRFQAPESSTYNRAVGLGGNYWGTTNGMIINKHIIDFDDFQSLLDIIEGEVLTEAPSNTFPFVASITLLNSSSQPVTTVGNELITVMVTMNRDMDQTIPLRVRFGSAFPYADYEISGSYITPRTWIGTYQLSTLIENGNQYFTIENGAAYDDHFLRLQPDFGRFTFEIDTTAAQAMLMQGDATPEGIELSWFQDDFDTLAGYNIYRSTQEFGFYERLNSSVIPSEIKTYFDDTVAPGVRYYYNFTVVKTDLSESEPSGKLVIMSLDTMAPNIYHTPIYQAFTNSNLVVVASIIDNLTVHQAKVYYRITGETAWRSVTMTNNNNRYSAIISSTYITLQGLEYYIEAYDGVNYTFKGTSNTPYTIQVQLAVSDSSLGDVNGDGMITTLDALMILQAINGRINLTAEQFLRADLDKSTTLEAWEALKILMYVSGKITSMV